MYFLYITNDFFVCIIDYLKTVIVLKNLLQFNISKKIYNKLLFFFTIIAILTFASLYKYPRQYWVLYHIPAIFLALSITFSLFNFKLFISFIISYICICELDVFISAIFQLLTQKDNDSLIKDIICGIVSLLTVYMVTKICKQYKFRSNLKYSKVILGIELLTLILVILLIGAITDLVNKNSFTGKLIILTTSLIAIIFSSIGPVLGMILISNQKYKEMSILNQKMLEAQISHYDEIRKRNSDLRKFRHDIQGHIICIKYLLTLNKVSEVLEYIEKMQLNIGSYIPQTITGNEVIDAILIEKRELAKNNQIILNVLGTVPGNINVDKYYLCIIIINIINNAIEACLCIPHNRYINLKIGGYNNYLSITAENPTNNFNNLKTTKKDKKNHGLGLANIQHAVDILNGTLSINYSENIFSIKILLKC